MDIQDGIQWMQKCCSLRYHDSLLVRCFYVETSPLSLPVCSESIQSLNFRRTHDTHFLGVRSATLLTADA
jgi:hypothetical protein